ncbi:cytochrome P450 [Colletotrichum phormii]|uniref:Cytochrome P450 n=1 Tax=Colletotrichum phormii TaxID=359342 RepID=A0AAJ0EEX9_9PEZI|nr:cytochrome P450 [Colletotrichum phormii]KAK1636338.1 cytochrome P450 [Colletotrichum phormii]
MSFTFGSLTIYHGLLLVPIAIIATTIYYTALTLYNIYFHPLSSFPGPRLAAATPYWMALSYLGGRTPYDLLELQNKYRPVPEFSKDSKYFSALKGDPVIITADREYHSYIRKLFAHGFSEKAMREQEGVLKGFVDILFARLGEEGEGGRAVDVVQWYNFLTFDFVGFLSLTYLLLKNPRVLAKLATEVRSTFTHPDGITFTGVNGCKYLLACIEEALRVYPPSPQPHHRIVPAGGATVEGVFLPEGTSVSIPIYAASHSSVNWTLPEEFIPERWMATKDGGHGKGDGDGDGDVDVRLFAGDQRDASQPFQVGPRNCIGRNLAYAEIKIIMARSVWQFDIENAMDGDWIGMQKVFMVWEKAPLWVKLHPVSRG